MKAQGISPVDHCRRHNIGYRAKAKDILVKIDTHIRSFAYRVVHYGNSKDNLKKRYLSGYFIILKFSLFIYHTTSLKKQKYCDF